MIKNKPNRRIIWLEADRFDLKPNKSPWLEMGSKLTDNGFNVEIITSFSRQRYQPQNYNVKIEYVSAPDIPWLYRYGLLIRMLWWVVVNGKRNDIVIVNSVSLLIAPALRMIGIKNIHLDVRTVPVEVNSFKSKVDRLLFWKIPLALFRRYASGYSFITERLKQAVEQEYKTRFDNYIIWQSGVNTHKFNISGPVVHSTVPERFVLFYHGSLTKKRGIDHVIDAIALLDQAYRDKIVFIVIGDGPWLDALKELVKIKGVTKNVQFEGLMPYEEMPKEIAKADCGIYPLPDRPEWNVSSPLKVLEYMACGKPMILTPIPANKDVLENEDFVVWAKSHKAVDIKEAIMYAMDNREQLQLAAEKGPIIVAQRHDWTILGQRLATYLSQTFP